MSDIWKCPHCERQNTKSKGHQFYSGFALIGLSEAERKVACEKCYRTVDVQDLLDGKYDVASLHNRRIQSTPEQEKRDRKLGCAFMILGAIAAIIAYQFFGVIVSLVIGIATFLVATVVFALITKREAADTPLGEQSSQRPQTTDARPVGWESLPRVGNTLVERWMGPSVNEVKTQVPEGSQFMVVISPHKIAQQACVWNVPTFYVINDEPCCFFRTNLLYKEDEIAIRDSVVRNEVTLRATFKALPTFPIISLLLLAPTHEKPFPMEAAPNLVLADVRDFLDILSRTGKGTFHFFLGDPPELLSQGYFSVESIAELRRCLDEAAEHFWSIPPKEIDHQKAADEYFRTTPLPLA